MAWRFWENLSWPVTAYPGLYSATFITVLALALALYYVVSGRSKNFEEQMQQLGEITEEELKQYKAACNMISSVWLSRDLMINVVESTVNLSQVPETLPV
ncbi:unnamed protein product [Ilex paraguariensis]|uniref:Uncharacterized protein n=1 Tax=Ilex paraguariensis TaxID=185542 RepID=A0ABC8QZN2_9AQUA